MLRIRTAAARHAVWAVVMAAMLLSPLMPRLAVPLLPAAENAVLEIVYVPEAPAIEVSPTQTAVVAVESPARRSVPWLPIVYGLGLTLMLARLALATWRTRMLTPSEIAVPVTIGLLRPRPLLPESAVDWPEPLRKLALAHEQAHARRYDPLIQWLAHLNRAVFWFHPLAWMLVRHLGRLAEEACDDAVLVAGHEAAGYAEALVEMGGSVSAAGGTLAMTGAPLQGRVERILAGAPAMTGPAPRSAAVMAGAIIFCFAACQPASRSQARLPGEPTMNELMHRQAKESRLREPPTLTPADVERLEATLRTNPNDHDTRRRLHGHYYQFNKVKDQNRHVLWAIEHAPESSVALHFIHPEYVPEDYRRGKQLWLAHLRQSQPPATVLANAARYFQAAEKPAAEQTLFRGQKLYPQDPGWRGQLASLYYQALIGSNAPLELGVVRRVGHDAATRRFAAAVREKLAQSQDANLLGQIGSRLLQDTFNPSLRKQLETDLRPLAKSYLERASALQPGIRQAEARLALSADREALYEIYLLRHQKGPDEALRSATGIQRVRLQLLLARESFIRKDMPGAERYARAVLQSAAGHSLFDANLLLAKVALRNKDKRKSVRYLDAAARVPPDEMMKHQEVGMELPRALVDWGERDAVADFLERVAAFSNRKSQLLEWAKLIREGRNPNLIPYHTGCPNEPC